jgi:hypothetical protein
LIPEEIKKRINLGNACCHSVQNLSHFCLLSKDVRIYTNINLPVVLNGCATWSLTLREKCILKVFENTVLRRIFELKRLERTA